MDLNKNSWYAKWYKFAYLTDNLPTSLCTLIWGLLFSIPFVVLSNPIWMISLIYKKITKKNMDMILCFIALVLNIFCLIICIFDGGKYENIPMLWLIVASIVGVLFASVFLIAILSYIISHLYNINKPTILKQSLKDFKERTCTLIKWK